MVSHLSDDELEKLTSNVGGHDPIKINSAYEAAKNSEGKPTVILARTVKGWGLDLLLLVGILHIKRKKQTKMSKMDV